MNILVKLPSRERPEQFMEVMRENVATCDDLSRVHWLFSFDHDDQSMWGIGAELGSLPIEGTIRFGHSSSKVEAINRDIGDLNEPGSVVPWDILLVLSDDMRPVEKGWDTVIREAFAEYHPDGDGLIWYFDNYQRSISTIPLMGRRYYDRFGYVYHPSYQSLFCDNEATDVAKALGRLTFIDRVLFTHRHPANTSEAANDALYKRNEALWGVDNRNYRRRKAKGFPA